MKTKLLLFRLLCIGLMSCEIDNKREDDKKNITEVEGVDNDETFENQEESSKDQNYIENGALPGVFSVSDTKQVKFSQGNLQYQASTNTWRFAKHQYDMVGIGFGQTDEDNHCYIGGTVSNSDNREISSTYSGWIDLFGWGTGNNPTNKSIDYKDYSTFVDWGANKISNGGNEAGLWRTLTEEEWNYLLESRSDASAKRGTAEVCGIRGLILLPDNWTLPRGVKFTSELLSYSGIVYGTNYYNIQEWKVMESAGAVFLPDAGMRKMKILSLVGMSGSYWSSSMKQLINGVIEVVHMETYYCYTRTILPYYGLSVRLCSEL